MVVCLFSHEKNRVQRDLTSQPDIKVSSKEENLYFSANVPLTKNTLYTPLSAMCGVVVVLVVSNALEGPFFGCFAPHEGHEG